MSTIDNTSRSMRDPLRAEAFRLDALEAVDGQSQPIEAMERIGQMQLVASDRLPVDTEGTDAEFRALGFAFGDPDPGDPLFRPAVLPDGWRREAADHSMWSYIVDPLGRCRVRVFYKAAFYDRRASMRPASVGSYVSACLYDGTPIVTDDAWATPEAVAAALRDLWDSTVESLGVWLRHGHPDQVAEYAWRRDRCAALLAGYAPAGCGRTAATDPGVLLRSYVRDCAAAGAQPAFGPAGGWATRDTVTAVLRDLRDEALDAAAVWEALHGDGGQAPVCRAAADRYEALRLRYGQGA